jgi:hypothetical protein
MSTTFLAGFAAGASVALGLSIAFVLFCIRFAKVHREPIEHFDGDWK